MEVDNIKEVNLKAAHKEVDAILTGQGITIDRDHIDYKRLCLNVLKARAGLREVEIEHQKGYLNKKFDYDRFGLSHIKQYQSNKPDPVPAKPKAQTEPEQKSITLGSLADAFEKDKRGSWSPSATNKWNGIRKMFFRFHDPDTQVHKITRKAFYEYRELLRCMLKAFMTTKKYDGMTAADVKALDVTNPINSKTVNAHVIFLHGMFKLAVNLEYISRNPATDMQVSIKGDARKLRDVFTGDELKQIFNSEALLDAKYPYQFWVTILSMFTGARREELCNLYRDDVKQEDGVWYIDITADKPDKRIKTYQIRSVPLHPFVLDLGFIEYVEAIKPGERLWPELNNNNRDQKYGHYYGRWFNNTLLGPLKIKPTAAEKAKGAPAKDHHSFRHTIINIGIRAGMDIQKVKGLVGHKEKGVTFGTYFKGFTVKQVYDEIVSKIDHGVNLERLKESKWCVGGVNKSSV